MKAVVPASIPPLPPGATGWARSTRRAGTVFHAHELGLSLCSEGPYMPEKKRIDLKTYGDVAFFGICPRCYAKVPK